MNDKKNFFHIFLKSFVCASVLGFLSLVLIVRYDDQIKKYANKKFKALFYTNFDGIFSGTLKQLSIIPFCLEFHDVYVASKVPGRWHWQAKKFYLSFSWIRALIARTINLSVSVQDVHSTSCIDTHNVPFIVDHLKRFIMSNVPVPIGLNNLQIKNALCSFVDQQRSLEYTLTCNAHTTLLNKVLNVNLYMHDGAILSDHHEKVTSLEGKLYGNIPLKEGLPVTLTLQSRATLAFLKGPQEQINCAVEWHDTKGTVHVYNDDKTWTTFMGATYKPHDGFQSEFYVHCPLSYISRYVPLFLPLNLDGNAQIQGSCRYSQDIQATVTLNVMHGNGRIEGDFDYRDHIITGKLNAYKENLYNVLFSCSCDDSFERGDFTGSCLGDIPLCLPWYIKAQNAQVKGQLNNGALSGKFSVTADNATTEQAIVTKGTYSVHKDAIAVEGLVNNDSFTLTMPFDYFPLPTITYFEQNKKEILKIKAKNNHMLQGYIDYAWLQKIMQWYGLKLNGTGIFNLKAHLKNDGIHTLLSLNNANILIPGFYNHIQQASLDMFFDLVQKKITINNACIGFNKGTMSTKQAHIAFDESLSTPSLFLPFVIDRILINKEKNFFATLTGAGCYKGGCQSSLSGNLVIQNCHLKQNIFSTNLHNYFMVGAGTSTLNKYLQAINLNMNVQTKNALHVKTPLLESVATIDTTIQGTLANPHIAGTLTLTSGSLHFPYKPLMISSGTIIFVPGQLYDPLINLTAQAKIRNYHVSMHIHGSAQTPHITLESAPTLSEEQIITLLLAGNEDGAFALAVPSLAMNQLQQVIFSSDVEESKLERYFKHILGPLGNIRFIPRFADQTARGGFRGIIQVDVSDKLRGVIQKNFSLTEDTKLEVEYYATDDLTVRAIRDERGDLGGEVEMRLKF